MTATPDHPHTGTAAPRHRPRLQPGHSNGPAERAEDRAAAIAAKLAAAFAGESVRTLEALAAVEANRPRTRRRIDPAMAARNLDPARLRQCRRIARRALAGTLSTEAATAVAYHRDSAQPAWTQGRETVAEVDGFVFYGPSASAERARGGAIR